LTALLLGPFGCVMSFPERGQVRSPLGVILLGLRAGVG
jgi:hypothetical protein